MNQRVALSLILLGVTCAMLSALAIHAQQSAGLTPCPSRPAHVNGIRGTRTETAASREKVHVVQVTLDGADGLPETARARVTRRAEKANFDKDSDWPAYIGEDLKQELQDYGYFKATVRPQVGILSSGSLGDQVWVTFHVNQGFQYRLGQVQFTHASVFPIAELRRQVPLRDGDIFDLSKIRIGIDALTKSYGAHGYINFVGTPDIKIDDANKSIAVLIQLDEGNRFRVGSVRILGLGQESAERGLKLELQPGMVFNTDLVKEFYEQNKPILPADASPRKDTTITQDARSHSVAIVFDFRACPEVPKRPAVAGPVLPHRRF